MYEGILKKGKSYEEIVSDIQDKSLVDLWRGVYGSLYPDHLFEILGVFHGSLSDEEIHSRVLPFQVIEGNKFFSAILSLQDVSDQLDLLKGSLIDIESEWFNKEEKKIEIQADFPDLNLLMRVLHNNSEYLEFQNTALLLSKLVDDIYDLTDAKADAAEITLQYAFKESVNVKRSDMQFGQEMIASISYLNESNSVTNNEVVAMVSHDDISLIISLLSIGSLKAALELIQVIDVNQIPFMGQTEKDFLVNKLQEYLP